MSERESKSSYTRRFGVIRKPGQLGSRGGYTIDGGEDAPLSDRSRAIYIYSLLAIFVVFVAVVLLTAAGH